MHTRVQQRRRRRGGWTLGAVCLSEIRLVRIPTVQNTTAHVSTVYTCTVQNIHTLWFVRVRVQYSTVQYISDARAAAAGLPTNWQFDW